MERMDELHKFRIIDTHVHNWSLFSDTGDLAEYLDRFRLEAIVVLSDLRGSVVRIVRRRLVQQYVDHFRILKNPMAF